MIVHYVLGKFGTEDSYNTKVYGLFSTKEKAEKFVAKERGRSCSLIIKYEKMTKHIEEEYGENGNGLFWDELPVETQQEYNQLHIDVPYGAETKCEFEIIDIEVDALDTE